MAADILLYNSDVVPVGLDQKQHIEITRDIAEAFNRTYGKTLKLPEGIIQEDVQSIPGIDGRKMSKSYNNTLPIFAPEKTLRKQVMRIVTDSRTPDEPKDPDACNLFNIYKFFAPAERLAEIRHKYIQGGLAYGELKQELADLILLYFKDGREKFTQLMADKGSIDAMLIEGAEKARAIAKPILAKVRKATGID